MRITRAQLRKIIREATAPRARLLNHRSRRWLWEDANPEEIESSRFPLKLGDVNKDTAATIVQGGSEKKDKKKDDDTVKVKKGQPYSCKDLKPSQTSMNVDKAMQFALSMINGTMPGSGGPGGDLGAFVSSDNFIMDGHHRWIATFMVDPSAQIKGIAVNLPGTKLVAVLNTVTKGMHGVEKGKPGTGGFDQFKDVKAMKAALEKQVSVSAGKMQGPIKGTQETEAIKSLLKKWCGEEDDDNVVDAAVEKMMNNLSSMPSEIMSGAPDRSDMPVIDDEQSPGATEKTISALTGGDIDLNPPYFKGEEGEKKPENAGRVRQGTVVVERWQRLAGIIK